MKNFKLIQASLAIFLFGALAPMPYSYYELLRVFAILIFSIKALFAYKEKEFMHVFLYLFLFIIFQPFYKLHIGKPLWNIIDVLVGTYFIINLRKSKTKFSS